MASAALTNSRSTMERMVLTASPGVFAGGGDCIWLNAIVEQQSKTKSPNILKLRMSLLLFDFSVCRIVILSDLGENPSCSAVESLLKTCPLRHRAHKEIAEKGRFQSLTT